VRLVGPSAPATKRGRPSRAAARVGLDDVGAGGEEGVVDGGDQLRPRQDQEVVRALEVPRPAGEPFPAVFRLVEARALDHGAHGAVEHEDALREGGLEDLDPALPRLAHAAALRPSAWQMA
jgi:hypothetical protein